jgi:glycosyltransferase involved in cell wall biosynthesis
MKAKHQQDQHSISAFFPAYNDGGTIASMVISAMLVLETLTDDYEIIVINDGSSDYTPEILDRLAADYKRVRVIHHPTNQGYGGVLRTGFGAATKDLIFYTDGDAQYDVRDLHRLYPLLTEEVDMVQGYKTKRSDTLIRKIIGRFYHTGMKMLFGLKVRDVDCDFRLMRRQIFDRVKLRHNSGIICVELVKKVQDFGFNIVETGVSHYPRVYGRSQFFRFAHLFRTVKGLLALWFELAVQRKHLSSLVRPDLQASKVGADAVR